MARSGDQPQNPRMVVQKGQMTPSVVAYGLDRLADLGISHVFGVPCDIETMHQTTTPDRSWPASTIGD